MQEPPIDKVPGSENLAEEYERLRLKHSRCEARLGELRGRLLLSEEEKLEEVTLKKQKLQLKDRMETIGRQRQGTGVADSR